MKYLKTFLKFMGFVMVVCLLLYVFNMISFALPNSFIRKHIKESSSIISRTNAYPEMVIDSNNVISSKGMYTLDHFIESFILIVSYDSLESHKKLYERSIGAYICSKKISILCFHDVVEDKVLPDIDYARYWFGTSSVLRFFLLFLNLFEIRYLLEVLMFLLLLYMLYLIAKELSIYYALIYLFAFITMGLIILPFSLVYAPNIFLVIISNIVILLCYKKEKFKKYINYIFALIGILTSYFDLLTFPLVMFAYPFITYFLVSHSKEEKDKEYYKKIVLISISWLLGYMISSIFKIILSAIIIGPEVWKNAMTQLSFRMSTEETKCTNRWDVYRILLPMTFNKMNNLIIGCFYLVNVYIIIKKKLYKEIDYHNIITIVGVLLIPMVWYFIFFEHSFRHRFFTFRNNSIILLCLLIIPLLFYIKKEKKKKK